MSKKKIIVSLTVLCFISLLAFLLYPKSFIEKYEKISIGENEVKVLDIMGKPWRTIPNISDSGEVTKNYTHYWLKPSYKLISSYPFYKIEYSELCSVNITFEEDKVVHKNKEP